ncbi:hypothetical protein [Pseudoalteromonas denitrificans]|uniref:Phage integrase family protein n=1 Tax=Pseudoalteromonas denitrificans DSM 6059 TaxID=1123010 RepID=A0A1I1IS17_9GAMM|nr:hypothetical protein [Pseudoalteromonas denitrificans]SFC37088.1 hypothetical protein SAMN02745724_01526 [Pseudoalteromonas denitrificans DSM 6059]
MAKSKKTKIKLSIPDSKVATLPVVDVNGLPKYKHYTDSLYHSVRLFFEEPKSTDEVTDSRYPRKSYFRAAKYSTGKKDAFLMVRDGKELVGYEIATTFAQLTIKKMSLADISKSTLGKIHSTINSLFGFLSTLESPPTSADKLSMEHVSRWLSTLTTNTAKTYKSHFKTLVDLHPTLSKRNLTAIKLKEKTTSVRDLSKVDLDKLKEEYDYSDKELIQILAYAFYEIEQAQRHFNALEKSSEIGLGDDFIPLNNVKMSNKKIFELLESGNEGHEKLLKNIYIYIRNERNGIRHTPYSSDLNYFMARLRTACSRKNKYNHLDSFMDFLYSLGWAITGGKTESKVKYASILSLQSDHHELAILLYTLITTGLNLETVLDWRVRVNDKLWYDIFDVELGVTSKTPSRDKSIVLVGKKAKGYGSSKFISTPVKINSPLYNYLKFLDSNRNADRTFFFNISDLHRKLTAFALNYNIVDDSGASLKSIETRRIRKVFAGHKLLRLLKDVKNADELIAKLKDALNHSQFDTTLFSYILKSGVGNLVINSAIVALTSDLLEKALTFQGKIKEDGERSSDTHKVYLCDCSDPSNPSHELPIAVSCRKYDMCLGCERSEVYSEHLPAICYRIMQYENKQSSDPEIFKVTLEDRLYIARDTIDKFRIRHQNGVELVELAYEQANNAMQNETPLLPPILQTGGI